MLLLQGIHDLEEKISKLVQEHVFSGEKEKHESKTKNIFNAQTSGGSDLSEEESPRDLRVDRKSADETKSMLYESMKKRKVVSSCFFLWKEFFLISKRRHEAH